ncbi:MULTISPECIES: anthrone oxygenase family protein [unclassified Streptomyces]|uniref:anthrone oxygenase family protein n=1 Tax=unclassified Streptomyces TaxID=2593676 RepID=UPI00336A4855
MTYHHALQTPVLIAATVATGLSAGLFYGYTCSVMPGLGQADDRTFVEAMQRINVAILNGWFALVFGGALLLAGLAAVMHLRGEGRPALPWIVAAVALYVVMLMITFRVSVPLNDALAGAGHPDRLTGPDLAAVRERFEQRWVRWNVVRALSSTGAFALLVWALVVSARGGTRGTG